MKSSKQALFLLLACILVDGCISMGNGEVKTLNPQRAAALLVPGITTQAEVSRVLGKGKSVKFGTGYEVWLYDFEKGAPAWTNFLPFVGQATSPEGVHGTELRILFNDHGVVKKYSLADFSAEF